MIASSRSGQFRIPSESLQDRGNNQQLAEIIGSINHLQELRERVRNLTLMSVHHEDLQDSTRTAVLAAIQPFAILALLAAGSLAVWKVCGDKLKATATAWS